jgi:hypothetical protein
MQAGTIDESFYSQLLGPGGGTSHNIGSSSVSFSVEISQGYDHEFDISYGPTIFSNTVFDEKP